MSPTRKPPRRFNAVEQTIYRDLQKSMTALGATSLRVSARDLLDPDDLTAEITFDRGGRRYVIRCARWEHWLDNLRACERVIYYLFRGATEYGVATARESIPDDLASTILSGFEALPDDPVLLLGSGRADWWEVLGVSPQATRADIANAYRALAKVHHPDAGGTADAFTRLRRAYSEASAAVRP